MVTPLVRAKVRAVAKERGLTLRALVLSALQDAGVLEDLAEAEIADRRATLAIAKARLWREQGRTMVEATEASPSSARNSGAAAPDVC